MAYNTYTEKNISDKKIAKAQKWLKNLGSSIKVTGRFTIGMTTALYKFQREHNLPITGELDRQTWRALRKENSWFYRIAITVFPGIFGIFS